MSAIAEESSYIPPVPSPYEGKNLSFSQQLKISAYWFATNFLWGALLLSMLPSQLRIMAPYYRVQAVSTLTALAAIVALVTPLVVGALSDRSAHRMGRRRPYMICGVAINVVGLFIMFGAFYFGNPLEQEFGNDAGFGQVLRLLAESPTFLLYFLGYVIVQVGNNIASASYSGIIPDVVPEDQRGAASGYMALMTQLGTLLGVAGCFALTKLVHTDVKTMEGLKYILVAVVLVGVAAVTILGTKENPLPTKPPKIHWPTYIKSLWIDPRQYPDFAWVWITRALVMLGFYSIVPFINYYLVDVIGIEHPDMAVVEIMAIILFTSSFSGIFGGSLSDKIGRKRVVYVANVSMALMAVIFVFCRHFTEVIVAGVFFGLGFGAYTSVDWALGTDVLPSKKDAAKEMAVWHIAMTLPQSIAAPLAGYMISMYGKTVIPPKVIGDDPIIHYNIPGYTAVFVFCAVTFGLGAILLRNVRGVK